MKIYNVSWLRRIVLPLLRHLNPGDIVIRHHYTGDPVRLHSFRHKGYWYHGRNREKSTMALFSRLLVPGDTVVEIGGHIGYISLFFKHLVQNGEVWVFEPGENNLPYVRKNVSKKGINLVEKAAGDRNGKEVFFLESLTGQNNSFVRGFKGLENNATNAFVGQPKITEATVEMVRGDDFINTHSITPSLIKIDVEGFELSVLNGMAGTIARCRPKLMVEVQADQEKIYQMLVGGGYVLFDARLSIRLKPRDLRGNIFALHSENHRMLLNQLGVDSQKQPVANS